MRGMSVSAFCARAYFRAKPPAAAAEWLGGWIGRRQLLHRIVVGSQDGIVRGLGTTIVSELHGGYEREGWVRNYAQPLDEEHW